MLVGVSQFLEPFSNIKTVNDISHRYIQSNFSGSNTFGTMKISLRQG